MEFIDYLLPILKNTPWYGYVAPVVAIASVIAAVTPTPAKSSPWHKLYVFIDALAVNIGKAKQKAEPKDDSK